MTFLFAHSKPVIGVIHVGALLWTPRGSRSVPELVRQTKEEARVYRECGVDGVIIENMHDVPYLKGEVGPEIVAAMTAISIEVKSECWLPVGIQILAGANIEIGADRVQVWTDVKKKTSAHAITADVSLGQTAETVEFIIEELQQQTGRGIDH